MDDTLLLMVLALVVLGPRRLPQIGRQLGKLMYEFRKASNDFKYQLEEELRNAEEADRRKREEAERQRALADAQTAVAQAQTAVAQAQTAAEQAFEAAAQAQSAAQAAQSVAESNVPDAATDAAPALPQPGKATDLGPAASESTYSYGYEEVVATESPAVAQPAAESGPNSASGSTSGSESASRAAPASEPASASAESSALRVHPPSTGEQVPAARPGRARRVPKPVVEPSIGPAAPGEDVSLKKEPAAEEQPAATESTAHHA